MPELLLGQIQALAFHTRRHLPDIVHDPAALRMPEAVRGDPDTDSGAPFLHQVINRTNRQPVTVARNEKGSIIGQILTPLPLQKNEPGVNLPQFNWNLQFPNRALCCQPGINNQLLFAEDIPYIQTNRFNPAQSEDPHGLQEGEIPLCLPILEPCNVAEQAFLLSFRQIIVSCVGSCCCDHDCLPIMVLSASGNEIPWAGGEATAGLQALPRETVKLLHP